MSALRFSITHRLVMLLLLLSLGSGWTRAQDTDLTWSQLPASEQKLLSPLQAQWASMDQIRRQKWREIAQRYPKLSAEQQERLRSRMVEWAAMSPSERNQARLQFEESKLVPAEERRVRWEAYRALPEEERKLLLDQATRRKSAAGTAQKPAAQASAAQPGGQPPPPRPGTALKPVQKLHVAPATVQAAEGASTRPMTQRPVPPRHQQAGLPKIAATPEFVDSRTLLPQRGPQGAAATPASSVP
ncbi:MAG: hypothetical protein RLY71_1271 [Pseudomonadota bacterium]